MTQQLIESNDSVSSPARNEKDVENSVSECVCANILTQTIGIVPDTETKILKVENHTITKICNPRSSRYQCDECNTAYGTKKQVLEDHPNYDFTKLKEFRPQKFSWESDY